MFHNGESEKYKKYRINKRQEKVWRKEFFVHWISRPEPNDLTALKRLENAGAMEALSEIIFQADKGDGYAKLRYADAIWSIADIPWYFKRKQALVTAINLWKSLVEEPYKII